MLPQTERPRQHQTTLPRLRSIMLTRRITQPVEDCLVVAHPPIPIFRRRRLRTPLFHIFAGLVLQNFQPRLSRASSASHLILIRTIRRSLLGTLSSILMCCRSGLGSCAISWQVYNFLLLFSLFDFDLEDRRIGYCVLTAAFSAALFKLYIPCTPTGVAA
jgi:hypothetical protein